MTPAVQSPTMRSRRPARAVTTLADFRPQRVNANAHTPRGLGMLDAAMAQDGYVAPMTAAADGEILDGSARLERAAERFAGVAPIIVPHDGTRPIIAVRTDIPNASTPEAKRIALAANRIAQADLQWSPEVLAQIVADMPDVTTGLWTREELAEILARAGATTDLDAEPQIDRAEALREAWGVEPGQLWQLGEHTILCGSTAKPEDVARAMGGEPFALLVADPPYGVSYADKNRFLNAVAKGNRIQKPICADHERPEAMFALWRGAFGALRSHAAPGASYYITGPQGGDLLFLLLRALTEAGFPLRHMLIWAKNNFVLGRSDYHYQHEPVLFGWVEGAHTFYGGHAETSLWAIDKPQKSDLHPTMKPVELWARALRNSTTAGAIVADGFCGSGTSIMACEQLGRRCRAIEVDPGYVAVSLQRWADCTHQQPERVS